MGFKMKGYSYPGHSPLKGKKKQAQLLAAQERKADAMSGVEDFGKIEGESTNLLAGTGTVYGQMPTGANPIKKLDDPSVGDQSHAFGESKQENIKSGNMWKDAGSAAIEAGATALITGGIQALFGAMKPKEKPKRSKGSASGFSSVKIGK
tara:strand:+ start:795 stop:1244 length:450 start_codon:yes stop_codon:yes gene_type:complete